MYSHGVFYQHKNNARPVIADFYEIIDRKRVECLSVDVLTLEKPQRTFHELWTLMDQAHSRYEAHGKNAEELTNVIKDITLNDVITMLKYTLNNKVDLSKALKSSSITDVATKITLIFKPVVRWKVKLHIFMGKNPSKELVHFHPYKLSSKVISGSFINHNYVVQDPMPNHSVEELQNEYSIPGVKRADVDGKPVVHHGKKLLVLSDSTFCKPGSVQEYPIEKPHSLEYDTSVCGKIISIAFISPTIHAESKIYDHRQLSETRRIGFDNEVHLKCFLEDVLFYLFLVKLQADLLDFLSINNQHLTNNEEYFLDNSDQPNSIENILLSLLAEYILQDDEENNRNFSVKTCLLFSRTIRENSVDSIFNAITSSQQAIEEAVNTTVEKFAVEDNTIAISSTSIQECVVFLAAPSCSGKGAFWRLLKRDGLVNDSMKIDTDSFSKINGYSELKAKGIRHPELDSELYEKHNSMRTTLLTERFGCQKITFIEVHLNASEVAQISLLAEMAKKNSCSTIIIGLSVQPYKLFQNIRKENKKHSISAPDIIQELRDFHHFFDLLTCFDYKFFIDFNSDHTKMEKPFIISLKPLEFDELVFHQQAWQLAKLNESIDIAELISKFNDGFDFGCGGERFEMQMSLPPSWTLLSKILHDEHQFINKLFRYLTPNKILLEYIDNFKPMQLEGSFKRFCLALPRKPYRIKLSQNEYLAEQLSGLINNCPSRNSLKFYSTPSFVNSSNLDSTNKKCNSLLYGQGLN